MEKCLDRRRRSRDNLRSKLGDDGIAVQNSFCTLALTCEEMEVKYNRAISSFRFGVSEVSAPLRCYAVLISSQLPTFRSSLSVLSSKVKQSVNHSLHEQ